jgi:hypothetical protein
MAVKKRAKAAPTLSALASRILSRWGAAKEGLPLERLESELDDERRYDIVAALKELEKANLGELSVGRKGHKTHLTRAPTRESRAASRSAAAREANAAGAAPGRASSERRARPASSAASPELLEHRFHVRPRVMATFRLPADVTRGEIQRLCELLMALPFR